MADNYVSPWAAQRAQREAAAAAPAAPMYTPEEIEARKGANSRAYQWGLLGLMMGDEGQQAAGGKVLQQALGSRQERVTDKGTFDPVTGQMRVNSQYARERAEDQLSRAEQQDMEAQFQHGNTLANQQFQAAQQDRSFGQQRSLQGQSQAFQAGQAEKLFGQQKELEGLRAADAAKKAATARPTTDESKAAKFAVRMVGAKAVLDEFEGAKRDEATGTYHQSGIGDNITQAAGAIPFVGDFARRITSSDEQKKYRSAQDLWLTSNLRSESGAVIGKEEAEADRIKFFPQPGDPPELIAQKREARAMAEAGMMQEAGRGFEPAWNYFVSTQPKATNAAASAAAPLKITPIGAPPRPRTSMLPRAQAAATGQPYQDPVTAPGGWGFRPG